MAKRYKDDQIVTPSRPFCPKCGSTDIRGSQSHRAMDILLRSFALHPYRCRSCRKRFYMRKPAEPDDQLTQAADAGGSRPADSNTKF
jgi:hypothetical protein